MASEYTTRLGLEKQEPGENFNQWGERLNNALDLTDEAIAGRAAISLTGNHTLTNTLNETNQARKAALVFTDGGLSAVPTVTIPAKEKIYYVENRGATYAITFTAGGTTGSVPAGATCWVICDGTNVKVFDPLSVVINKNGLVLYNAEQALTAGQKVQAQTNINAASETFTSPAGASYIRPLSQKTQDSISPEDFRAVGGDDDYATIMEGLEYLQGEGGGSIKFPDDGRTYTLSQTLNLALYTGSTSISNISLQGNRCRLAPADNDIGALIKINGGEAEINNFMFMGDTFTSVDAIRNLSPAASNAVQVRVTNNFFTGFAKSFHSEADGYQFNSNTIRNPATAGVYSANRGMNSQILGNYIYPFTAGAHGIVLTKTDWQPEGVLIGDNIVFATGLGGKALKILSGLSIHVRNNILDQHHGIVVDGSTHVIADVDFVGNWVGRHSSYDGTDPLFDILGNVSDLRSVNDTIIGPNGLLRIASGAQNVMFSGTRFRMTSDAAVAVDNSASTTQLFSPQFTRSDAVTSSTDIDGNGVSMLVVGGRLSNPPVTTDDSKVIYVGVIGKNYGTLTGDLKSEVGLGSLSDLALRFRDDPNTGLYRYASDVAGLVAGGVDAARIDVKGILIDRTKGLHGDAVNIINDNITSFTPPSATGILTASTTEGICEFRYKTGVSPSCDIAIASPPAFFAASTGVPTGTTGTDNFITV